MATRPEGDGRQALLVVGMHRSGTSALALALSKLGWALGEDLLEPQADVNRQGFGENRAVVEFNERLLERFGHRWYQFFSLPGDWLASVATEYVAEASAILEQQFADGARILLKDPRLCLTLPVWRRALDAAGVASRAILTLRHPEAVAGSLERRDSLPRSTACLLWAHYMLEAERASRGMPRTVLQYEDLLERGAAALAELPGVDIAAGVDCGIDPGLSHHGGGEFGREDDVSDLCRRVMAALLDLGSVDTARQMDEIREDLAALLGHAGQLAVLNETLDHLVGRAGEAVRIGEQHSAAMAVIQAKDGEIARAAAYAEECERAVAEKDGEIARANEYAAECEAAVGRKDTEIEDIRRYASECEAAVKTKDGEIAEVSAYARHCEGTVAERDEQLQALRNEVQALQQQLDDVRAQRLYRILRRLRLLR